MRKMQRGGCELNIVEHVILRNFWEYYITDEKHNEDIVMAVVMGFETECGDISLSEIEPYVALRTKNLSGVIPAEGWSWV